VGVGKVEGLMIDDDGLLISVCLKDNKNNETAAIERTVIIRSRRTRVSLVFI